MKPKFVIKPNSQGYYYITLVAANGEIQWVGEAYETKRKNQSKRVALEGLEAIKRNTFIAETVVE